jgi:hypothetical protein
MSVIYPRPRIHIRANRSPKVATRTAKKMEAAPPASDASLIYAGYPYDPYV